MEDCVTWRGLKIEEFLHLMVHPCDSNELDTSVHLVKSHLVSATSRVFRLTAISCRLSHLPLSRRAIAMDAPSTNADVRPHLKFPAFIPRSNILFASASSPGPCCI